MPIVNFNSPTAALLNDTRPAGHTKDMSGFGVVQNFVLLPSVDLSGFQAHYYEVVHQHWTASWHFTHELSDFAEYTPIKDGAFLTTAKKGAPLQIKGEGTVIL